MKTMWRICCIHLLDMTGFNRARYYPDKKKRKGKIALTLFIYLALLSLLPACFALAWAMAVGLDALGQVHLLPPLALVIASLSSLFASIFKVNGMLFASKDDDLLLSLPVRHSQVIGARLMVMYAMNLLFSLVVLLSSSVAYALFADVSFSFYPISLIAILLAPLLPTIIGSFLGVLVSRLAASFRGARYARLLFLFLFVLAYVYCMTSVTQNAEHMDILLGRWGVLLSDAINRMYPPAALYGSAISQGNWGALAGFALVNILPFAAFALVLERFYTGINTALTTTKAGATFRSDALKRSSPLKALYLKELRRYLTCTVYVFNTAFGLLLALIGMAYLGLSGSLTPIVTLLQMELPGLSLPFDELIGPVLAFIACFMVSTACTTSASISLEGKQLWIIKSMPVSAGQILLSKLLVNLTITLPACLAIGLIADLTLPLSSAHIVMIYLLPAAYSLMIALLGLIVNLKMHRFDWPNETVIVKQSISTFLPILFGMVATFAPMVLCILWADAAALVAWAALAFSLLLSAVFALVLRARGEKLVRTL